MRLMIFVAIAIGAPVALHVLDRLHSRWAWRRAQRFAEQYVRTHREMRK